MPRPALRRKKRVYKRTPGGRLVIHYKKDKRNKDKCAICKNILHGTYHGYGNMSKTKRRPKRIFGGYLCSNCLQKLIVNKVISEVKI